MKVSEHRNRLRLLLLVGIFVLSVSAGSHAKESVTAAPGCDQADLTADRVNSNACRDNATTVENKNQDLLKELLQADAAQQTEQTAKEKTIIIITDTPHPAR